MTTIVYCPRTRTLAADRLRLCGETPVRELGGLKIRPLVHEGRFFLVCGAGQPSHVATLVRHYFTAARVCGAPVALEPPPNATAMLVELNPKTGAHTTTLLTADGSISNITHRPFAVGSGADYALGAMSMGAEPGLAVEKASELDIHTGDGVQIERIDGWMARAQDPTAPFDGCIEDDAWTRSAKAASAEVNEQLAKAANASTNFGASVSWRGDAGTDYHSERPGE